MSGTRFGPAPQGLAFGARGSGWMRRFQFAADFMTGAARLNGRRSSVAEIDALYHTRASMRYASDSDGRVNLSAINEAALTDLGYDHRDGWTVLNASPLNPRLWQADSAGTFADLPGDFLGFSSATTFTGLGQSFHRARSNIGDGLIVPGGVYAVRALYRAGTSPRARVHVRCAITAGDAKVDGLLGSLSVTSNSAGQISQIENIDRGGGLYECRFLYTCTITGTGWSLSIGPDSGVNGQTIGIIAGQITRTDWHVPWGSGAVAADRLIIPAADAGLAVSPAAAGRALVLVWRGRCHPAPDSFARCVEVAVDTNQSLCLLYRSGTGLRTDIVQGGTAVTATALTQPGYGADATVVSVWRPDGSVAVAGPGGLLTRTQPPISQPLTAFSLGSTVNGGRINNMQCKLAAAGLLSNFGDADALALYNRIAA